MKILGNPGLEPALVEPISFYVKKNGEIIQATCAQTSTEETRQTKELTTVIQFPEDD